MPRKSSLGHVSQGLDKDVEPIMAGSMAEANITVYLETESYGLAESLRASREERAHANAPRPP